MKRTALLIVLTLAMLAGCAEEKEKGAAPSSTDQSPVVSVSNYPLQYFTERLAPWVDVHFPAQGSGDPAYWKPSTQNIAAMQKADLVILNGASYETWLANVTLSEAKLVDTSAGLKAQFIPLDGHVTHSHGPEGEHEHTGTAFTLWLDLTLAQAQVKALSNALTSKWPNRRTVIEQSATVLISDLESLDGQLKTVVRAAADRPVLFSHPVYQYLQKRYEMNGKSVHWEPDVMPDEAMWKELTELRKDHPAKWMIWEGEALPAIKEELSEMGICSVVFDPCGGKPDQGDFLSVMKQNVAELQKVFGSQSSPDRIAP